MDESINLQLTDVPRGELMEYLAVVLKAQNSPPAGYRYTVQPPRSPDGFSALDPDSVKIALYLLSGSGAAAVFLRSLAQALIEYIRQKHSGVVEIHMKGESLKITGDLEQENLTNLVNEFIQRLDERGKEDKQASSKKK